MREVGADRQSAACKCRLYCGSLLVASVVCFLVAVGSPTRGHGADIELGRYLATECTTCHGAAKSDSTIPNIRGLGETHLAEVIKAYRAKTLPNPVMQTVASRLNDEEIAALAAYFASAK